MPAYIIETGRSYPNVVTSGSFSQTFKLESDLSRYWSRDYDWR